MNKDKTKTATEITEDELDTISGGPHFRTWDGTYYDYSDGSKSSDKPFTSLPPMGWDNTKH